MKPKRPALPPRNELQSNVCGVVIPKLKPTQTDQHKRPFSPTNEDQILFLKKSINVDDKEKSNSSDEDTSPRNSTTNNSTSQTKSPSSSSTNIESQLESPTKLFYFDSFFNIYNNIFLH
ncbi:hypothetical protein ACTFIU_009196 [Dictyostelium citrinum]